MTWRQLPDGSWLNSMTGDMAGLDPAREAIGRTIAERSKQRAPSGLAGASRNPSPPTPSQKMVVLPGIRGPQAIIDPKRGLLSVNPYELGLGASEPMSDGKKKILLVAGVIGAAAAFVWWQGRGKKAKAE
jgi:hypothetical protein